MSGLIEIIQNLDKRVDALESESIEESALVTNVNKLYTDIEIDVVWSFFPHRYRRCGDAQPLYPARAGTDSYL